MNAGSRDNDERSTRKGNSDDEFLTDHTISMRRACDYCLVQYSLIPEHLSQAIVPLVKEGKEPSLAETGDLDDQRRNSQKAFWNGRPSPAEMTTSELSPSIETIHIRDISNPQEFRNRFHIPNLPCLIHGMQEKEFCQVNQYWTTRQHRRQWFLDNVGPETQVPLRYFPHKQQYSKVTSEGVDSEGRATECQTRHVTMTGWIDKILPMAGEEDQDYYLKDWHLQVHLEAKETCNTPLQCHDYKKTKNLYQVPDLFQFDLLNSFLMKFTSGDYRFCYWGPKNSTTGRHADVLNSFSWSYNVVGTKEWTFYSPKEEEETNEKSLTLIQRAGQAVFVPSTWQHSVSNLEETISINHNWITTANLDLTWKCLQTEIKAIGKELADWGIDDNNWEAHESMLRGCVGLDVTAFLLMILVRLLDLLLVVLVSSNDDDTGKRRRSPEQLWDVCRLSQMLDVVVSDHSVHLYQRLEAVLQDEDRVRQTHAIIKQCCGLHKELIKMAI